MPVNWHHSVVITNDGTLICCGCNSAGQLGTSDCEDPIEFTPVIPAAKFTCVSCGNFTVACAEDGTLWAWGTEGETGIQKNVNQPTQIPLVKEFLTPEFTEVVAHFRGRKKCQRPQLTQIPKFSAPPYFVSVSCGWVHTVALDSSGIAWGFGINQYAQLGLNHTDVVKIPTKIPLEREIQMISCGSVITLFLDYEHRVWSCGKNEFGQLGLGDTAQRKVPTLIPTLENIQLVDAGSEHSLALDFQGHVLSFGCNKYGQIGRKTNCWSPQQIPGLNNCIHIMCGGSFSVVHLSDGKVMFFGYIGSDESGLREPVPTENPELFGKIIIPGGSHMLVGDPNGDLMCYGKISGKTVSPISGINLPVPAYLKKKFGKNARNLPVRKNV